MAVFFSLRWSSSKRLYGVSVPGRCSWKIHLFLQAWKQTWKYMVQKIPQRNPNKSKGGRCRGDDFPPLTLVACALRVSVACGCPTEVHGASQHTAVVKNSCPVWNLPCVSDLLNVADFSPIHHFWFNIIVQTQSASQASNCQSYPSLTTEGPLRKGQWVEIDFAKHGLGRQIHHYSLILCSCEVIVSMFGPNFKQRQGTP